MFRIKSLLLLLLLLLAGTGAQAQIYPVQVTVVPTPPHRNYLNSFSEQGALNVFLTLTDFNSGPVSVKLKMELNGPGYQFRSLPNNLVYVLNPGQPLQIPMEDLAVFFSSTGQSLNFNPSKLPEGNTSICVDVIKNQSGELLSNNGCGYFYMGYGQPATLLQPACNSTVEIPAGYPASTDLRTLPLQFNFIPAIAPVGLQQEVENTLYIYNWLGTVNTNPPLTPAGLALAVDPIELGPVTAHTLLPINNQLIVGQEYVWYVKTSLNGSTNQFQNGGWSAPCKFQYGSAQSVEEVLAQGLSVEWIDLVSNSESKGTASWKVVKEDPNSSATFNQFILKYRKVVAAGEEPFEWFADTVNNLSKAIYQLEPATTYEASVAGRLGSFVSEPTEIRTFTTAPPRSYACGVANFPGKATAFQPLEYADPGMKVKIGMFQLEFVSVQNAGQPGHFSGTGLIPIDFLFGAEARVKFDDLKIDKEYDVWDGTASVITEGLDAWLEEQYQQFQDPIYVNGTVDSAYVSDSIAHVIIDGVDTTFTFPCATCPVIINDIAGNQITIYPNGTVVWNSYLDVSDEQLDVPDTEIGVFQQNENETGGFDPFEHIEWNANYEIIRTSNAVNYFVANKSMREGVTDKVNVAVPKNKYGPGDVQLSWDGLATPIEPTSNSVSGNDRIFTFDLPIFEEGEVEIYAKNNELKIGKLNLVVYEAIEKHIVVVPLAGTIDVSQLTTYLNQTLGEAGINFNVTISDTIGVGQFATMTFNIPDARLMNKFGTGMKKARKAYFENHDSEEETYYLFVSAGLQDTVNNNAVDGYMVRGKNTGFVTIAASNSTISHELCHGIGAIGHTWNDNGPEEGTTNNLMDYNNGINLINKQWEALRNPSDGSFWDDEEDSEAPYHIAYYFWEENEDHSIKTLENGSFLLRPYKNKYPIKGYYFEGEWSGYGEDQQYTTTKYDAAYEYNKTFNTVVQAAEGVKSYINTKKLIRYQNDKFRSCILILQNNKLKRFEQVYQPREQQINNYVIYFTLRNNKLFYSHSSSKLELELTDYNQSVYEHMYVVVKKEGANVIEENVYDYEGNNINSRFVKSKVLNVYINGYIYGVDPGPYDDIEPKGPYWRQSYKNSEQFIVASKNYLNPGVGSAYEFYLNGSGDGIASSSATRQIYGMQVAPTVIKDLKKSIKDLKAKNVYINEINFITHSMGAAYCEGLLIKMIQDSTLKPMIEKGQIVHFSACDGGDITIPVSTSELKRCQLNYQRDRTLNWADGWTDGGTYGGEKIPGVSRRGLVLSDIKILHPNSTEADHDFHYDSKTYDDAWKAVEYLYTHNNFNDGWIFIPSDAINN